MTHSAISLGLGLGGGKSATSSGGVPGGGSFVNEYSLDFDGTDDRLTLGDLSYVSSASALTLSVWFKTSNNNAYIYSSYATGASVAFYESFQVYFHSSDTLNLVVGTGSNYAQVATSSTSFNDGNWHHGAFVFDGGSPALKIYVDGTLQTVSATGTTVPSTLVADAGDGATVSSYAHAGSGYYLNAVIDEVAFFDSVLSAEDISTLRGGASAGSLGAPADIEDLNPVGWWRMGDDATWDGTNWTIPDASTNSNAGTTANMAEGSRVTDIPS